MLPSRGYYAKCVNGVVVLYEMLRLEYIWELDLPVNGLCTYLRFTARDCSKSRTSAVAFCLEVRLGWQRPLVPQVAFAHRPGSTEGR